MAEWGYLHRSGGLPALPGALQEVLQPQGAGGLMHHDGWAPACDLGADPGGQGSAGIG